MQLGARFAMYMHDKHNLCTIIIILLLTNAGT